MRQQVWILFCIVGMLLSFSGVNAENSRPDHAAADAILSADRFAGLAAAEDSNLTGGDHPIEQKPPEPQQTADPNPPPTVPPPQPTIPPPQPTIPPPVIQPTVPPPVVPQATAPQATAVPTSGLQPAATEPQTAPLAGVYCATSSALIRINDVDAPEPPAGCVCVKAYGAHTLQSGPDLYIGTDETQIQFFVNSTTQCLAGVTTYNWTSAGFDQGSYQPNPNGEPVEPESGTAAPVNEALILLVDARTDLETLATSTVGITRPAGWSGSLDVTDPTLPLLVRFDLELLAEAVLGAGNRPAGWFGSVASTPYALARDVRHDIELLADAALGKGTRPTGWVGTKGNTLLLCDRATQTLVNLLQRGGVFTLTIDPADPDFCLKAALEASTFSELTLLSSPADRPIFSAGVQSTLAGAHSIDTDFAVAFLDKGAALSVGVIPKGEPITPVARSTAQFSRMTLVQGTDFLVFVDYRDTTLTEEQFEALPDAGTIETQPFCSASWCGD